MPINSKDKGARAEIALCKLLQARFPGKPFSRSVGSGNRWAQVAALPCHAVETYSGDLVCPPGFRWTVECKFGYDDVDLGSLATNKTLDGFLSQATADADRSGRKPLLAFKQSRRPWVAFVEQVSLSAAFLEASDHLIGYRGWIGLPLEILLKLPDDFWFNDL